MKTSEHKLCQTILKIVTWHHDFVTSYDDDEEKLHHACHECRRINVVLGHFRLIDDVKASCRFTGNMTPEYIVSVVGAKPVPHRFQI